ncbi:hypothetical protein NPIL_248651 [Nephila pilipes]|uniref:G-protein coupled receptors family 1 profile domain-containing protein n=1 Tax=Nephila pilipes TaxID=299642 RepID=A0A8X6TX48_NEPPI|nr:hypothetical protein NPIL_248651 [Nephila pilipes]
MILFFLPAIVMIVLYMILLCRIFRRKIPGEATISNVNAHQKAKKKMMKKICIFLVTFIVCWSPMQVAILYSKVWLSRTQDEEVRF